MSHRPVGYPVSREVFEDPIVALAAICPICALAALSPAAALAAFSPVLRIFNPAINPAAALLDFVSSPRTSLAMGIHRRVQGRVATCTWKNALSQLYHA